MQWERIGTGSIESNVKYRFVKRTYWISNLSLTVTYDHNKSTHFVEWRNVFVSLN